MTENPQLTQEKKGKLLIEDVKAAEYLKTAQHMEKVEKCTIDGQEKKIMRQCFKCKHIGGINN